MGARSPGIYFYQTDKGRWGFTLKSGSGDALMISFITYGRKDAARRAAKRAVEAAAGVRE